MTTEPDNAPKTFINHPNNWKFQALLTTLFKHPDPDHITEETLTFLRQYPLFIEDFPVCKHTYSRTILYRSPNGYEAMAARWDKKAVSSIHGHPHYALILVVKGRLGVEYYTKTGDRVELTSSAVLTEYDFFSDVGRQGNFDNHIHRVKACEETLSIHISSDDAAKGEVFRLD